MLSVIIENILYVVALVLLFGLTVFVHELGHFLAARRFGLVVDTFSIGFGPAIWQKKIKKTVYRIGCIPVGGYVALPQLDPAGMETIQGKDGKKRKRRLKKVSATSKIVVSFCGSFGNVLLAILLAWVIFLSPGANIEDLKPLVVDVAEQSDAYAAGLRSGDVVKFVNDEKVLTWNDFLVECHIDGGIKSQVDLTVESGGELRTVNVPVVDRGDGFGAVSDVSAAGPCLAYEVQPDSAAAEAGIMAGDIFIKFNGQKVAGPSHLRTLTDVKKGSKVSVEFEREGELIVVDVKPRYDRKEKRTFFGVVPGRKVTFQWPWEQYKRPLDQVKGDANGIFKFLGKLTSRRPGVAKRAAGSVTGPIGIFVMLWMSIKTSLWSAVAFIRFLNINLAIINLLPIPVLDGGHIVFALWEGVTRRKVNPTLVNILINFFMILLILVFLLISSKDFKRFIWGNRAKSKETVEQKTETAPKMELEEDEGIVPAYPGGGCSRLNVNR